MEVRHVQAELSAKEYEALRRASEKEGRTIKEAVREAALAWTREKQGGDDPIFQLIGIAKGPSRHAARDHDEIYDGD